MRKQLVSSSVSPEKSGFLPCVWFQNLSDPEKQKVTVGFSIIGVLLFIIFNIVVYRFGVSYGQKKHIATIPTPSPTPTPTPIPLNCKGEYKFSVSSKGEGGFVQKGFLSPCDPKRGAEQKLQITANSDAVTEIQAELQTDGKKQSIPLTKHASQKNVWECSWVMDDTYDYTYAVIIKGKIGEKEVKLPMMLR